ncbi:MAG TPA: hypothetical protein DCW31_01850, partial [Lactobacillus sp.]|nr:hypothetical protein [Lactobacillus sp.]
MRRRILQVFITLISLLSILNFAPTVRAATYTATEQRQIKKIQRSYRKLSTRAYDQQNSYAVRPSFDRKMVAGKLTKSYQKQLLASLNFYRQVEGLPPVYYAFNANQQAQVAAADMAAAGNFSHGLKDIKRPSVVSKSQWQTGQRITLNSN